VNVLHAAGRDQYSVLGGDCAVAGGQHADGQVVLAGEADGGSDVLGADRADDDDRLVLNRQVVPGDLVGEFRVTGHVQGPGHLAGQCAADPDCFGNHGH
jgi:hypothetical protein